MATNFPGSQDSFTNPTSADTLASPDHAAQHADVNDAVEAIETALLDGAPLHIDDANERVGIGTTTPARTLEVQSSSGAVANFGSDATNAYITLTDSGTTSNTQVRVGAVGDEMRLYAGGSEAVRIDSSGSVGIGTTTPDTNMHVYDASTNVVALFESGDSSAGIAFKDSDSTGNYYDRQIRVAGDDMHFQTGNTDRVTITSSGNVGIGTTSPSSPLHLFGAGNAVDQIRISSTGGTVSEYGFLAADASTNVMRYGYWTGSGFGNHHFEGNVGVNDSTPSYTLDVNGTFRSTGAAYTSSLQLNSGPILSDAGAENDLRLTTAYGYLDFGPLNTSWCHFQTDRPAFYFYKYINMAGGSTVRGDLTIDGLLYLGSRGLRQVSGSYGTVQTHGSGAGNWEGYSIDGRVVFMHDGANAWGIYNDVNNEWMLYGTLNGSVELKHNNVTKAYTDSSGFRVAGRLYSDSGTSSFDVLQVRNEIQLAYGSVTDPPITWSSDGDTGIYGANDRVYIGTSGVMRAAFGNNFCDFYGESRFYYDTSSNDWSAQPIQAVAGTANDIGIAIRSYGSDTHTTQMRASSGILFIRSHNDGGYHTVAAIISSQSSRDEKQDIVEWSPPVPVSAGSMTNPEYATTMSLVNQLNVVSYRWDKQRYCIANEVCEDDPDHDDTHICGRDCDSSVEEPCNYYRQWERGTIGLVAEEVGEVIPQVTDIDMKSGENKAIDGLALTSVLVKALQEIDARLSALEAA